MSGIKKERWTEAQVIALPAGEHDYFDRKSGALLTDPEFRLKCAKALSAYANSGGGHLILGMRDDGTFDGVAPLRGRTPTREWMEQIVPSLLTYPLEDFRVHEVVPDTPTTIPASTVVLVVDVGDSALAPHQATPNKTYYYRELGHTKPAPHFYLETLRNRLVRPSLEAELVGIHATHSAEVHGGLFVETELEFRITNKGRVAAYKWALSIDEMVCDDARVDDYKFSFFDFPTRRGRSSGIRIDDTILPSLALVEKKDFGLQLRPKSLSEEDLIAECRTMIYPDFEIKFRVVSETSPGELLTKKVAEVIDFDEFVKSMVHI
jgi:hypothetical protein